MAATDLDAAIAASRFGLGARAGEIAAARSDPRGFLKAQVRRTGADTPATDGDTTSADTVADAASATVDGTTATPPPPTANAVDAAHDRDDDAAVATAATSPSGRGTTPLVVRQPADDDGAPLTAEELTLKPSGDAAVSVSPFSAIAARVINATSVDDITAA